MEFNVSTFIFEIINFLILVWILQRLFYKPLLAVIAKRKQFIDQSLTDAKNTQQQAEGQRSLYENRQKLWEQEKQAALAELHQQISVERKVLMAQLSVDLEQERQKFAVTCQRQQQELLLQAEHQALQNDARFAGLLLQQAASPELEARLLTLLLANLKSLPEACTAGLQTLVAKKPLAVRITSAYPLTPVQCQVLEQKLAALINSPINCQYHQDTALIAGIRLDIGAWVFNANLQYELIAFAEMANEAE